MRGVDLNTKNVHAKNVNWFASAGGALTLVLAAASLSVPWWQITLGQTLARIGFSPGNLSTNIVGYSVALPIIAAVSWMFMGLLVSAGIVLVVYSIMPSKPYSKGLLGFAYKKPLGTLIAFLVLLLLLTNSGTILSIMPGSSNLSAADLNVPWTGTKTLQLPSSMAQGSTIRGITVSTEFGWTFWLAVAVAGLCVAARLYHKKLELPVADEGVPQSSREAATSV
jgi:hypothetical protein